MRREGKAHRLPGRWLVAYWPEGGYHHVRDEQRDEHRREDEHRDEYRDACWPEDEQGHVPDEQLDEQRDADEQGHVPDEQRDEHRDADEQGHVPDEQRDEHRCEDEHRREDDQWHEYRDARWSGDEPQDAYRPEFRRREHRWRLCVLMPEEAQKLLIVADEEDQRPTMLLSR